LKFYTNNIYSAGEGRGPHETDHSFNDIGEPSARMIIRETGDINIGSYNLRIGTYDTSYLCVFDLSNSEFMIPPRGTSAERSRMYNGHVDQTMYEGAIRYNTDDKRFEGFGYDHHWNSLGGVCNVDQNTFITAEDSPDSGNNQLKFYTNNSYIPTEIAHKDELTLRMVIDNTGDISMFYSLDIAADLDVGNDMIVTGNVTATTYTAVSDESLKENITLLENPLEKTTSLTGKNYTWKSDQNSKRQAGLIAQETEQVIPEAVDNKNTLKSINYNAIIPYLIESIKIQQTQITNLEERIKSLENK